MQGANYHGPDHAQYFVLFCHDIRNVPAFICILFSYITMATEVHCELSRPIHTRRARGPVASDNSLRWVTQVFVL